MQHEAYLFLHLTTREVNVLRGNQSQQWQEAAPLIASLVSPRCFGFQRIINDGAHELGSPGPLPGPMWRQWSCSWFRAGAKRCLEEQPGAMGRANGDWEKGYPALCGCNSPLTPELPYQ